MPRVVLAPDSFKGSLSAPEVCAALARGLTRAMPQVEIRTRPMADGGEGTLDAVLAAVGSAGRREQARVTGAGGDPVDAAYGLVPHRDGLTAVIEIAQVVGITDPIAMRTSVRARSTRGLGELVKRLLDAGVRRFMVGLGGSSTNDGGSGLLSALGVELIGDRGGTIAATPDGLVSLARITTVGLDARIAGCEFRIMSDVNNPLTGALGATAIFGPQKGVVADDVERIDETLGRYAELAEAAFVRNVADLPGAGAAGGLGFAFQLLGGTVNSGAEVVAELIGLNAALKGADWAITGEGRSDRQTLLAKAPFVVAQHAAAHSVPVTLVSGSVDATASADLGRHFAGCFGLPNAPMSLADCIARAPELLESRAEQLGRVFVAGRSSSARPVE
jgi:glycerate kinase